MLNKLKPRYFRASSLPTYDFPGFIQPYKLINSWQTVQTQISRHRTRRLIRVSTVCKYFNHFSLERSKSHSLTYLKSKLESSNIKCGGVHSVYNGLILGTRCALLIAELLLLCYEIDFMLSLSQENQANIMEPFSVPKFY